MANPLCGADARCYSTYGVGGHLTPLSPVPPCSRSSSPLGTPPSTPAIMMTGSMSGPKTAAVAGDEEVPLTVYPGLGGTSADPPYLLPESGFVSPANGVEAEGILSQNPSPKNRRSTRRGAGQRDELFKRRLKQHRQRDMLFELREDGTYEMKEMSIREVFNYVQGGTMARGEGDGGGGVMLFCFVAVVVPVHRVKRFFFCRMESTFSLKL